MNIKRCDSDADVGSTLPNGELCLPAASTNTLMCGTSAGAERLPRNSEWNKMHITNPLFYFVLKLKTPDPDCNHNPECGPCGL